MNISETTAAKSDQQNYDDYLGGKTRTVTITAVTKGSDEQPVKIELAEFPGRPYKPNLSMRRVLLVSWGDEASTYVGRRMKLFGNPNVVWAGKAVGGIEIEALSHIDKPITMALTQTRGKRRSFTVKPLEDAAPTPAPTPSLTAEVIEQWVAAFNDAPDIANLQILWKQATDAGATSNPHILAAKDKRKGELT